MHTVFRMHIIPSAMPASRSTPFSQPEGHEGQTADRIPRPLGLAARWQVPVQGVRWGEPHAAAARGRANRVTLRWQRRRRWMAGSAAVRMAGPTRGPPRCLWVLHGPSLPHATVCTLLGGVGTATAATAGGGWPARGPAMTVNARMAVARVSTHSVATPCNSVPPVRVVSGRRCCRRTGTPPRSDVGTRLAGASATVLRIATSIP